MTTDIDRWLDAYDRGRLTRRELIAAIGALAFAAPAAAQDGVVKARSLHHVNVRVADVARSEAFYRKVFGVPASRPVQGAAFALDLPGGGFISLCPLTTATCGVKSDARAGDIDHFAIGIDKFDAKAVAAGLKSEGIDASGDQTSLWISDPDGTHLQLSAVAESFQPPR